MTMVAAGFDMNPVTVSPLSWQSPYRWFVLVGIAFGALGWWRMSRRDRRLVPIYLTGLLGAFVGAKLAFLFAEGWQYWRLPVPWLPLLTGKSVLGALPGGYAGVEFAKWRLDYRQHTGDWFAAFAPAGILLGRVGCLFQGCCLGARCERTRWWTLADAAGQPRWPAVPVEMLFNAMALAIFWVLRRRRLLPGQHFHLYLMAYAAFRFFHEFARDTPRFLHDGRMLSGYQIIALGVFAFGARAFYSRQRSQEKRASVATPLEHPRVNGWGSSTGSLPTSTLRGIEVEQEVGLPEHKHGTKW